MTSDDRLRELEERYEGYTVYDNTGEKIGKVDDLFVDETDREEYIGVKTGFFGLKSTLIPMELVRINDRERTMEVLESKDHVKDAPTFGDDEDITSEYEDRIRRHFGLGRLEPSAERGTYGRYSGATASGAVGATPAETGMDPEVRMGRESYWDREDLGPSESPMESAGAPPSGGMADLETGDRSRVGDEDYREGYREGFREGLREGLREGGGRGEFGDRGDLEPSATGPEPAGEGTMRPDVGEPSLRESRESGTRDRTTGEAQPGDESRQIPRRSDEGERGESELTRVWGRIRR